MHAISNLVFAVTQEAVLTTKPELTQTNKSFVDN
jgi:hypothetical protein